MEYSGTCRFACPPAFRSGLAVTLFVSGFAGGPALAVDDYFQPGNLLVSRVVYDNNPNNVQVGALLPPNCVGTACVMATSNGTYPYVWNNNRVDGSFGITAKILLDQLTPAGVLVNSLEVPNSSQNGVPPTRDQMVGSFSSKSEVALNLSTDGQLVTFMGYLAPIDALDVSNSNTPGVVDPTNPVNEANFRVVAQVDGHGKFHFTKTNAYSGNNGRAAILNNLNGANVLYTAGNAGNGSNPQPDGVIIGAGAQILDAQTKALVAQDPGLRPSAASTSRNSATSRTRSARTPTSAVSPPSTMSSIPPKAAAATASTRSISSIRRDSIAPAGRWRARRESVFRARRPACRPRRLFTTPASCKRTGSCPTTCAF
jgi:hypothetical protein